MSHNTYTDIFIDNYEINGPDFYPIGSVFEGKFVTVSLKKDKRFVVVYKYDTKFGYERPKNFYTDMGIFGEIMEGIEIKGFEKIPNTFLMRMSLRETLTRVQSVEWDAFRLTKLFRAQLDFAEEKRKTNKSKSNYCNVKFIYSVFYEKYDISRKKN